MWDGEGGEKSVFHPGQLSAWKSSVTMYGNQCALLSEMSGACEDSPASTSNNTRHYFFLLGFWLTVLCGL